MSKYKIIRILIIIAFPLCVYFFIIPKIDSYGRCANQKRALKKSYNGIVLNKYIDNSNHNYHTLLLNHTPKKVPIAGFELTHTNDSIYSFIEVGDSIFKEKGSKFLYVYKDGEMFDFHLFIDCY